MCVYMSACLNVAIKEFEIFSLTCSTDEPASPENLILLSERLSYTLSDYKSNLNSCQHIFFIFHLYFLFIIYLFIIFMSYVSHVVLLLIW